MKNRLIISIAAGVIFSALSFVPVFAQAESAVQLDAFFTSEQLSTLSDEAKALLAEKLGQSPDRQIFEREVNVVSKLLDKRLRALKGTLTEDEADKLMQKMNRRLFTIIKNRRQTALRLSRIELLRRAKAAEGTARKERLEVTRRIKAIRKDLQKQKITTGVNVSTGYGDLIRVDAANGLIGISTKAGTEFTFSINDKSSLSAVNDEGNRITTTLDQFQVGDKVFVMFVRPVETSDSTGPFQTLSLVKLKK